MVSRFQRSCNRTAPLVSQNHEQLRIQMDSSVFNAAGNIIGNDVSGDANDKEISEPLIKDEFHRNTRVAASQNDGKGVLARFKLVS